MRILISDGEDYYLAYPDSPLGVIRFNEMDGRRELETNLQTLAKFNNSLEEVEYDEAPAWVRRFVDEELAQ